MLYLLLKASIEMITKFLRENQNKTITLAWGLDTFEGVLTFHGRDWWIVSGQAFHVSQVSSMGMMLSQAYVVVS